MAAWALKPEPSRPTSSSRVKAGGQPSKSPSRLQQRLLSRPTTDSDAVEWPAHPTRSPGSVTSAFVNVFGVINTPTTPRSAQTGCRNAAFVLENTITGPAQPPSSAVYFATENTQPSLKIAHQAGRNSENDRRQTSKSYSKNEIFQHSSRSLPALPTSGAASGAQLNYWTSSSRASHSRSQTTPLNPASQPSSLTPPAATPDSTVAALIHFATALSGEDLRLRYELLKELYKENNLPSFVIPEAMFTSRSTTTEANPTPATPANPTTANDSSPTASQPISTSAESATVIAPEPKVTTSIAAPKMFNPYTTVMSFVEETPTRECKNSTYHCGTQYMNTRTGTAANCQNSTMNRSPQ
ncbi:uncharacterized protein [Procambarus clarkii]|uniref:uncharacterized protein n=1 Tax=Procambarus clarkii TaxID=6728 RepID=UPI0037446454